MKKQKKEKLKISIRFKLFLILSKAALHAFREVLIPGVFKNKADVNAYIYLLQSSHHNNPEKKTL